MFSDFTEEATVPGGSRSGRTRIAPSQQSSSYVEEKTDPGGGCLAPTTPMDRVEALSRRPIEELILGIQTGDLFYVYGDPQRADDCNAIIVRGNRWSWLSLDERTGERLVMGEWHPFTATLRSAVNREWRLVATAIVTTPPT